jgi:acyl-CoA thioesterase YciA
MEDIITSKMCMTKDVGTHGNLFGGIMMAWMDEAGAIFARKYTQSNHVVTVKFNEILFKYPVKVGQIVDFYAGNPVIGNTSISFDLIGRVDEKEVVKTGCIFVALDENGTPKKINK